MWDRAQCEAIHLLHLILDAGRSRILKASVAVLLNHSWVLIRNFTQLSLSSKTLCHVNRTVTEGPCFTSCCLTMGEGFCSDLGLTLSHVVVLHPFTVCHHYCLTVNLKHVTCGRLLSLRLTLVVWLIAQTNVLFLDDCLYYFQVHSMTTNTMGYQCLHLSSLGNWDQYMTYSTTPQILKYLPRSFLHLPIPIVYIIIICSVILSTCQHV